MRQTSLWNDQWQFQIEGAADWEPVCLPHTWNALDGQDGGGDYYQGKAWYRKRFLSETPWEQVFLRFGAVSKRAEVYCNGQLVGSHNGGFSAFTLELTPYLRQGENELTVMADNSADLPIYPEYADFTFFGGIYREVELICFDTKAHFDVEAFGTDAVLITPDVTGAVTVQASLTGSGLLRTEILNEAGAAVAAEEEIVSAGDHVTRLAVPQPHRWDGTADPYLYTARLTLSSAGKELDRFSDSFGFRDYFVSPSEGFFLNGRSYPLHGVCRHQDREDMGWAITEKEHIEDMSLIRELGANTLRLAHYQHAPFFYHLCDQEGMVVWAEIPFISGHDPRPEADANLLQQLRDLILQNYNHPSICFWGIANELGIAKETEAMLSITRRLNDLAKQLDATRPTVIANVGMTVPESPLFHITDLTSYNEYMGWYTGSADDHGSFCDERHSRIPEIPMAVSEYGADCLLQWHSAQPKVQDYTEEYQAIVHEKAMAAFNARPYLWATWLWNMFDFAADGRDEGGCKGRNNKGLVTYDRKTKKQAFFFYKALWSKEPFVYLCGKRYLKRAAEKIEVKVYTNLPHAALWVNGHFVGEQDGNTVFLFPDVPLRMGFNELVARTPEGCMDSLILERVASEPEEYVFKESKNFSSAVAQWFADVSQEPVSRELDIRPGYLSVNDSMELIYSVPEGYKAVKELVIKALAIDNPGAAKRMESGGALSFTDLWHHIQKQLPDEVYYLLNERLNRIPKP